MTKIVFGKTASGVHKYRVLVDGANENTPAFGDVLFDADFPTLRIFHKESLNIAPRTGAPILATISFSSIGYIPLVLAGLRRQAAYFFMRHSPNDDSPNSIQANRASTWNVIGIPAITEAQVNQVQLPSYMESETGLGLGGYTMDVYADQINFVNFNYGGGRAATYRLGLNLVARED